MPATVNHSPEDPATGSGTRNARSLLKSRLLKLMAILVPLLIIIVAVGALLWPRIFVSIPAGQAGVVFRFFTGTRTDYVYPAGLHIIPPWDTMNFYEIRNQVMLHSFPVLSARGLMIDLEIAVRYRPQVDQLGLLHQKIGPDYARRVVVPQTESVLRRELGRRTAEEIYTNAGGLLNQAVGAAGQEVGRNFVVAEDIMIRKVTLPKLVRASIDEKLAQRELMESYVFRLETAEQEAERLREEGRGIRDYQEQVDSTLSDRLLQHSGIRVTREVAGSQNSSVVLIGSGKDGLPMIPGGQ
jgi:regulator of protease activity HflC (stomatin/prohibitin superfamily)